MKNNLEDLLKDKQLRDKGAFYSLAQILGMPVEDIPEDKLQVFKEIMEMTELYKLMADQSVLNMSRKQRRQQEKNYENRNKITPRHLPTSQTKRINKCLVLHYSIAYVIPYSSSN